MRPLGRPRSEVGEVVDGPGLEEAHRPLLAGLAEDALAGPEHDRVDHQPQLVDQVVVQQRADEPDAAGDDDLPANSCFSFETSCITSPASTVELFQAGSFRVEDTTNLGISFNLSANSPLRDGHRAARNS